jgi:hypothetical protein
MAKSNNNIYRDLNKQRDYLYKPKRKKNKIKKKVNFIKGSNIYPYILKNPAC